MAASDDPRGCAAAEREGRAMASKIGLSYRNEAAQARLSAALAGLGEGEAEARPPGSRRDGALEATQRLEWAAGVLERVAARERELAERIAELEAQLAKRSDGASRPARAAKRGE
jgi:hypothetical protein